MISDLHIHTCYSDGEKDEFEIIKEIIDSGIKEFAICDHDTIEGSKKVSRLLTKNDYGLIFHSGVELSCIYKDINVHLLVRNFDYDDKNIAYLINKISKLRKKKISRMLELVKKIYGIEIEKNKLESLMKITISFGKPHIYKLLCEYGDYNREEYYMHMDKLESKDLKLDVFEVVTKLKDSNCNITLAHPIEVMKEYNFTYDDIDLLVKELSVLGVNGLETRHSSQTYQEYLMFSKIAKKYNLIETSGSDYHGEGVKPGIKIGMIEKR